MCRLELWGQQHPLTPRPHRRKHVASIFVAEAKPSVVHWPENSQWLYASTPPTEYSRVIVSLLIKYNIALIYLRVLLNSEPPKRFGERNRMREEQAPGLATFRKSGQTTTPLPRWTAAYNFCSLWGTKWVSQHFCLNVCSGSGWFEEAVPS